MAIGYEALTAALAADEDKEELAEGVLRTTFEDRSIVFKAINAKRFQPDAARVAVAVSRVYGMLLGEGQAHPYELVIDASGQPKGQWCAFLTDAERVFEDGASPKPENPLKCLNREFGKMLAVSYCLEENDFNDGNLMLVTKEGIERLVKLDHDFSCVRFLESQGLLTKNVLEGSETVLTFGPDLFAAFPCVRGEGLAQYAPTLNWIENIYTGFRKAFKSALSSAEASKRERAEAFIQGMREGFESFLTLDLNDVEAKTNDILGKELQTLWLEHLKARKAMLDAVKDFIPSTAQRYGAPLVAAKNAFVIGPPGATGLDAATTTSSQANVSEEGFSAHK